MWILWLLIGVAFGVLIDRTFLHDVHLHRHHAEMTNHRFQMPRAKSKIGDGYEEDQ